MLVKGLQCCFGLDWHGFPHEEESKSHRFGMTWGWVNDIIYISGRTISLRQNLIQSVQTLSHTHIHDSKVIPNNNHTACQNSTSTNLMSGWTLVIFHFFPPAWLFFMDENKFKRCCKLKDTHLQSWPVTTEWVGQATLQLDNTTTSFFN